MLKYSNSRRVCKYLRIYNNRNTSTTITNSNSNSSNNNSNSSNNNSNNTSIATAGLSSSAALSPSSSSSTTTTTTSLSSLNENPFLSLHKLSFNNLIDAIKQIPIQVKELEVKAKKDYSKYGSDYAMAASHGGLFLRQLKMEEEQLSEASNLHAEILQQLSKIGSSTGLKRIQIKILDWYEPFLKEVVNELYLIESKVPGPDRQHYGPCLLLLPPEKLSIITMNCTLNHVMKCGNSGINVSMLSRDIGSLIESEINVQKLQKTSDAMKSWQKEILKKCIKDGPKNKLFTKRIHYLLGGEKWAADLETKVGAALLAMLVKSAKTDNDTLVFLHSIDFNPSSLKRMGKIRMDSDIYKILSTHSLTQLMPRHLPMIVPPKSWRRNRDSGCYFRIKSSLVRTFSLDQKDAVRKARMDKILIGLDYLGRIPWKINNSVLNVAKEAWKNKIIIGELPSQIDIPIPSIDECTHEDLLAYDLYANKRHQVLSALKVEIDEEVIRQKRYSELVRRTKQKNAELHSLRCDTNLKFVIADKFSEDRIYFPCNLDFRGRAYPIPPNLNHIGGDLCRSFLKFAEAKPLGPKGLYWIKVHLANLFGISKISHDDRVEWVDENIDNIFDSAKNSLNGERWWATAEEPFQALAACIEIVKALESGNHEEYLSDLPVHMDGSCNGLQHYAALGRDEIGGYAVNLLPSDFPQDVYSGVLSIVIDKINNDINISEDEIDEDLRLRGRCSRLVHNKVTRKVIKQTVMTSVYGVTRIGARQQVQNRLFEIFHDEGKIIAPEEEKELYKASKYVADLTLNSLNEMFTGAKDIMDWLSTCSVLVSQQGQAMSWITPMGLPVIQPYRKSKTHVIKTLLQTVSLAVDDDSLPVARKKQKSAFPPNFVHSLDATHMLLTALKMKQSRLHFASVHDSYWTHAQDIPEMNKVLRSCFVDLYSKPILEDLRESLVMRYPDVDFPPVPPRGKLDLEEVKNSTYFFH